MPMPIRIYLIILIIVGSNLLFGCELYNYQRSLSVSEVNDFVHREKINVIDVSDFNNQFTVIVFEKNIPDWEKEVGCYVSYQSKGGISFEKLTTLAHLSTIERAYKDVTILSGFILEHNIVCVSINSDLLMLSADRIQMTCVDRGMTKIIELAAKKGFVFVDSSVKCQGISILNRNSQEIFNSTIK